MRNNALIFEKYLEEHKIPMNKGLNIDNVTIFSFPEKLTVNGVERPLLGGGQERRAVISLSDDDSLADIYCFHIASVPKDVDKFKLYSLFNNLNSTYKYISFFEDNNVISCKSCIPFNNNFDADIVFQTLSIIFSALDEEYKNIIATL